MVEPDVETGFVVSYQRPKALTLPTIGRWQARRRVAARAADGPEGVSRKGRWYKVHAVIAKRVNDRHDPDFVAETSYLPFPEPGVRYGAKGTIRLDVLEKNLPLTVCVYDHKTGQSGLRAPRAVDIITIIQRHYPGTIRYIMIEVKPRL